MTPSEYVTVAVALLSVLGGALGVWIRVQITPLVHSQDRMADAIEALDNRTGEIEDKEAQHRQALPADVPYQELAHSGDAAQQRVHVRGD